MKNQTMTDYCPAILGKSELKIIEDSHLLNSVDPEERIERRAHKRFQVRKNAFVLIRSLSTKPGQQLDKSIDAITGIVFKSKPIKLGRINNISLGGLECRFEACDVRASDTFVLDIVSAANDLFLKELSCKNIYDLEMTYDFPMGPVRFRQIGVQYQNLDPNQFSILKEFIDHNCTVSEQLPLRNNAIQNQLV